MKFKKLTVALDCDDVLASCNTEAIKKLNSASGASFTKEDISGWGSDDGTKDRLRYFSDPAFVRAQPVIPGAKELVSRLIKRGCDILIVTSVPANCVAARNEWLRENFPEVPERNILYAARKEFLAVDVLIDDNPLTIGASIAKYPILVQQPWNKTLSGYRSVRADHIVDDTIDIIDMIMRFGGFQMTGRLSDIICLVGPSGAGKSEIADVLCSEHGFVRPNNYTTAFRPAPFKHVSLSEFVEWRDSGLFAEHTQYAGAYYGTLDSEIRDIVDGGKRMVMPIDLLGANALKRAYGDKVKAVYVHREQTELVSQILSKKLPKDEMVSRILALNVEAANEQFCDDSVDSSDVTEAARLIDGM